jgi:hypothetical protein
MKNKMKWVLTALSMAAVLVTALSCKVADDTDTTAPGAVTNLAAVCSSTGTTITVTWTKPTDSDLDHYSFLCTDTTNSGATVKSIDSVDAATTTETLTDAADSIVAGNAYRFTVYAYDASGNKSEGATASLATLTYIAGSIICSDGSVVTKDNYDASKMTAVAVACGGTSASGAPLAVGLGESGSLQWAPSGTTGFGTNFAATVCTPSATGTAGTASTATFTGDTYGGDNWDAVCAVDGTASANAAANYPAFNYANTYTATNYTSGWYVPSISELCTLYRNMTAVNDSLSKAKGTQIGTNGYWSSSQFSNTSGYAWYVNFSNGTVDGNYKVRNKYVRVIRAF